MRDVAIIGVGSTKFGELWDKSFREIGIEAGVKAINDAGITGADVEALYLGSMSSGRFINQEHIAPIITEHSGLLAGHIPATRVEAASASGGLALRQAFISVASGLHDLVVVGGAEKMTDVDDDEATETLAMSADQEWEGFFGATYPSLFAMMARRHMHEHGTTKEHLAHVAVKNHKHGALNPDAQYRREIKFEMALNAGMVADPLGVFDCAPTSDGAAALVLAPLDKAKEYTDKPVHIAGTGMATDTIALHGRRDICTIDSTVYAAKRAYEMAGIAAEDVQVAEVHDSFSISEIIAIEDLGFFPKGDGGPATERGDTMLGGKLPINTSGGLKARGHPIGATGIAQAVEIVIQLRGDAGDRQVPGARIGLTHNIGGTGGTGIVHILKGVEA